ncbi:TPA: hypothetical protein ACH3X1_006891 [Trebouxia sp. C0004]
MSNTDWKGRVSKLYDQLAGSASENPALVVSKDVQTALQQKQPVVALESTIISHGMPYPQNFRTALEVEEVVRSNGAVPATVAVLAGVPHVGLTEDQLHDIAKKGLKVKKTSRRDLAYVMARKLDGSTTVSATMVLAARAGIAVFVTGGMLQLTSTYILLSASDSATCNPGSAICFNGITIAAGRGGGCASGWRKQHGHLSGSH